MVSAIRANVVADRHQFKNISADIPIIKKQKLPCFGKPEPKKEGSPRNGEPKGGSTAPIEKRSRGFSD